MGVFYTSDLHLGHRLVAKHRGFGEDTAAHDAHIMERWNALVGENDLVYVLGDVAMGNLLQSMAILAQMNGRKRLIVGNHDRCHPMFRDAPKHEPVYREHFEWIAPFARRKINNKYVLMSHYPYHSDRGREVRDTQYRLRDEGMTLLHGHLHSKKAFNGHPHEIHVGWDTWGVPISDAKILQLIDLLRTGQEEKDHVG